MAAGAAAVALRQTVGVTHPGAAASAGVAHPAVAAVPPAAAGLAA